MSRTRVELEKLSDLTPDGHAAVKGLSAAVYPPEVRAHLPAQRITWARCDWGALVWHPREGLVAFAGALLRNGLHDGTAVGIGGIGSVKSHPEARGRGHASAAVTRVVRFLEDKSEVDFTLLFCRPKIAPFYARLGWQSFAGQVLVELPQGKGPLTGLVTMVRARARPAPARGVIDVCGLPW